MLYLNEEGGIQVGDGNRVVGNTLNLQGDVDSPYAIAVGSRNTVRENHVRGTFDKEITTAGIEIRGSYNLIQGNFVSQFTGEEAAGLRFRATSSDNVYRSNVLRGNAVAVDDDGTNNTDAGGNIQ